MGNVSRNHIVLWKWKQEGFVHAYTADHVNIMVDMIRRHANGMNLRLLLVTDDPTGVDQSRIDVAPLWNDFQSLPNRSGNKLPSCYRRLKLFDFETQGWLGIPKGDRITSLDLDTVITGDMRPLWMKREHFTGWAVRGISHNRVFNGSMFAFDAGTHQSVWSAFDPLRTPDRCIRAGFHGSDQSWLSFNFASNPTCGTWAYPLACSYPKEVRRRPVLSKGISVVFFHGKYKPWHSEVQQETPWVRKHWRHGDDLVPAGTVQVVAGARQARIA